MQCTHLITDLTDLVVFLSLEVSKHVLDVSTHTHTRTRISCSPFYMFTFNHFLKDINHTQARTHTLKMTGRSTLVNDYRATSQPNSTPNSPLSEFVGEFTYEFGVVKIHSSEIFTRCA